MFPCALEAPERCCMTVRRQHWQLVVAFLLWNATLPYAAADSFLGVEAGAQRGAFGSTVTTTLSALTVSWGWIGADSDVSISVPVIRMEDDAGTSESGMGDVILRAGKSAVWGGDHGMAVDLSASLKLPTADENKNLGSGAVDYGGFVTLRSMGSTLTASLVLGAIIVGEPSTVDYDNVTTLGGSLSKRWSQGGAYATLDRRSASIAGAGDPLEFGVGGYYVIDARHALSANTFVGLSDGSADHGWSVGWLRRFY